MNQRLFITVIDLRAQIVNVNVHNVGQAFETQIPDVLHDHRTGNSAAGVAHQVFQHGVFPLRQIDRLAGASHHVPHAIQFQVFHAEFIQQFLGAPQKSVDPGQQLFKRKWLYQVIIGASLQTDYESALAWDLRNFYDTSAADPAGYYGWRTGGDLGMLGEGFSGTNAPATGYYVPYPAYFAEELASQMIHAGDEVVSASSTTADFSYARIFR